MSALLRRLPSAPYPLILFLAIQSQILYRMDLAQWTVCTLSLAWLTYRLTDVVRKPVDELVRLLGLEVPSAPSVSLLDVSSNSLSLHWKGFDKSSAVKYAIRVNGVLVGEVSPHDSSATIVGLAAGVCYTVRIIAINSAKFQAASDPVRVQTSRASSASDNPSASEPKVPTYPSIVPYKGPHEGLTVPLAAPPMAREHSGSLSQLRRRNSSRRTSPSPFQDVNDGPNDDTSFGESSETLRNLTTRLEEIRRETYESQKQDEEDERQFQTEKATLAERRDALRQELKEKEDGIKELKKNVAALERQNTAVQQKKTNQEKMLESRQAERRKLREDVQRWDSEVSQSKDAVEAMRQEQEKVEKETQERLSEIRSQREPDVQAIKQLEEQIRELHKQVKDLEDAKNDSVDAAKNSSGPEETRAGDGRDFERRYERLSKSLQHVWQENYSAAQYLQTLRAQVAAMSIQRRDSQPMPFNVSSAPDIGSSGYDPAPPQPPHRSGSGRISASPFNPPFSAPPPPYSYTTSSQTRFPTTLSPEADSTWDSPSREGLSRADFERLTGGAMISPAANALLPSDLLGDDLDDPSRRHASRYSQHTNDSLGSRSSAHVPTSEFTVLPGLGTVPALDSLNAMPAQYPQSPIQGDSRSPSLTSSPHESVSGQRQRSSDANIESDRRSIRSNSSSNRAFPGQSRLLGSVFNRQRGKTDSEDGPRLGSLTTQQSRSLPRGLTGSESDLSVGDEKRTASGGLLGSVSHAFSSRRMGPSRLGGDDRRGPYPAHSNAFGRLGSRISPWSNSSLDQMTGSRPTSVYSAENALPQPSLEGQPFGWNDSASNLNRSNTTHSARQRVTPWGSAYASRRGSVQESGGQLSEDIEHDDDDEMSLHNRLASPTQAPIGTKPARGSHKKAHRDTQLNPAARDFRTMFSRDKKGDKSSSKSKKKLDKSTASAADESPRIAHEDHGTPVPREQASRSFGESAEDLVSSRTSESGPSTPAADGTPTNRESLMQRLTRKGSHIPGLKPRKAVSHTADDTDDDAASGTHGPVARTPSSITSSPQVPAEGGRERERDTASSKRSSGFSLSSFKRRSRRGGDKDAPSISETSMTSEGGDDDEGGGQRVSLSVED